MAAHIITALLSALIPTLFGGRGSRQQTTGQSMAPSVGAFQPSAAVQQPQVTNDGGFMKRAGMLLGNEMLSAFGSKMTARMRGQSTLRYNQAAFPGTNPWEQMGSGARGQELAQMASSQNQINQAERASIRQSQTQLGQSRMAATSALAGQIYANNGNASLAMISRILKNSGVLTEAGRDYQEAQLGDTQLQAQIGGLRSRANLDRVAASLQPFLASTGRISAGGALSKEAKSLIDMWNSSKMKGNFGKFLKGLGGRNNAATAPRIKNPLKLNIN